jgi:DNA polymerase-3 subunit chi
MTRIDFYFNADDKADVARKLAAKAYQAGQCALLFSADPAEAERLDSLLWTQPQLAFVPHVRCRHPLAKQTPILIGDDPEPLASPDLLVNLGVERPPCFSRFERLIEVVSRDPADRQAARERFRFYKERGYAIETRDLDARG